MLTSSWQAPDGRVGHLLVNISESPQPIQIHLDTRNAPGWPAADAALYSSESADSPPNAKPPSGSSQEEKASDGFRPLWKSVRLPREFARPLAPLEVVFVELRPSAGTASH